MLARQALCLLVISNLVVLEGSANAAPFVASTGAARGASKIRVVKTLSRMGRPTHYIRGLPQNRADAVLRIVSASDWLPVSVRTQGGRLSALNVKSSNSVDVFEKGTRRKNGMNLYYHFLKTAQGDKRLNALHIHNGRSDRSGELRFVRDSTGKLQQVERTFFNSRPRHQEVLKANTPGFFKSLREWTDDQLTVADLKKLTR